MPLHHLQLSPRWNVAIVHGIHRQRLRVRVQPAVGSISLYTLFAARSSPANTFPAAVIFFWRLYLSPGSRSREASNVHLDTHASVSLSFQPAPDTICDGLTESDTRMTKPNPRALHQNTAG
nr:hypothetical protein CFP56_65529 [Quercus suber]